MAIIKPVDDPAHPNQPKHLVLPAFSFAPTDALAQMIVDAWHNVPFSFTPPGGVLTNVNLRDALVQRDGNGLPTTLAKQTATARANAAGFDLTNAVVIKESEHDNDYIMQSGDEIVFVLPDDGRIKQPPTNLLDTAKLLMACTPNGI